MWHPSDTTGNIGNKCALRWSNDKAVAEVICNGFVVDVLVAESLALHSPSLTQSSPKSTGAILSRLLTGNVRTYDVGLECCGSKTLRECSSQVTCSVPQNALKYDIPFHAVHEFRRVTHR